MIVVEYAYDKAPPTYLVNIMEDLIKRQEECALCSDAAEAKGYSSQASRIVVYADYGTGPNISYHREFHKEIEYRYLYN